MRLGLLCPEPPAISPPTLMAPLYMDRTQSHQTLSLQSLERSVDSQGDSTILRDISQRERLKQVAQAKRAGFSLPFALLYSPEITRGMKEVDSFGFRTTTVLVDPSGTSLLAARTRKPGGFHVSDLWSQKQQQEFLKRLRQERAQYARERQVSFVNYLIENRKKLGRPNDFDSLRGKHPVVADADVQRIWSLRKAKLAGIGGIAPLRSKTGIVTIKEKVNPYCQPMGKETKKRRVKKVDGLIVQCTDTLLDCKREMKELALTTRSLGGKEEPHFGANTCRMARNSYCGARQKY